MNFKGRRTITLSEARRHKTPLLGSGPSVLPHGKPCLRCLNKYRDNRNRCSAHDKIGPSVLQGQPYFQAHGRPLPPNYTIVPFDCNGLIQPGQETIRSLLQVKRRSTPPALPEKVADRGRVEHNGPLIIITKTQEAACAADTPYTATLSKSNHSSP